ncbi:MAG: SusC/RagA family TonB-linked outer membrane protein [Clostridium sp.]|nr:SusC/RagA family TonB-linked outer membrane protein [Clostridium sp.]
MKKLFLLLVAVVSFAISLSAQTTIKGTVLSAEDDEPLPGATVQPLGGGAGVATNIDGEFTLTVPASVKKLRVSYVGYETVEVAVAPTMTIKLKSSANRLDEVVVTGYGSAKKPGSIVGSVAVVNSEAFANTPASTFVDALQGQVAGLSVLSASGDPSALENDIRIRGVNSLNSSLMPLFILDGAPISMAVFNTLNPSDIENIAVLKDAASTSIYGTRAANGVIVITSKKGKFGNNASVTIRGALGWSSMVKDPVDMMNAKQYLTFRELVGSPMPDDAYRAAYDFGIDTDWRAETFDGHAPIYSLEGTVTGGSDNISYYIGLSHYDQEGIIAQSGMRRDVLRANIAGRVRDWFRVSLQTNIGYAKFQQNNESNAAHSNSGIYITNPSVFARKALPVDAPRYYTIGEDGKPVWGETAEYLHFSQMPTPALVQSGRDVWRNRLTINATLSEQLNPIKELTIRATQSVDGYDYRLKNYNFPSTPFWTPMGDYYDYQGHLTGSNQQSFSRYASFSYNETVEYAKTINAVHNLSVLAGTESIISRSEGFGLFAEDYTDQRFMFLGYGNTIQTSNLSQSFGEETMNSYFFTADYNYDEKYYFNAAFRRDGSSLFPKKDRWGSFYSVGLMWNMKKEKFLQNVTWLDDLRIRASYGTAGNSGISNYLYFGLVGQSKTTYNGGNILGVSQQSLNDLTWEKVGSFDFGVSFGMFRNRLSGDIDFYTKETRDLLQYIPYSYTTGFGGGYGNIGNMRNTGIDIKLEGTLYQDKNWFVGLRANMNYNDNEITKLFQGRDYFTQDGTGLRLEVGHKAQEYYMVRYAGVDPRDGKPMWYTREGNLTKNYNENRDAIMTGKSPYSPISGGFGLSVSWKGLALSTDFAWSGKKYMINNDRYFMENTNFATDFNQMTSMLDVWTHPGQITDIPGVGNAIQFDTHLLENASFLRMKNLTVQYTLPKNWVTKAQLSDVKVRFTGRNLLTFTGYTGYDPEPESNIVSFFYPNTRQYEFGVEVTF